MACNSGHGTFVQKELICSKAYKELKSVGKEILVLFLLRQPVHKKNGKWILIKDGEISFTYSEAKNEHGISQQRFTKGIDAVIGKGFIELKYQGGGMEGDYSLFRVSEMWRKYGTDEFKVLHRPKKGIRIGFARKNYRKKNDPNLSKKIRNIHAK